MSGALQLEVPAISRFWPVFRGFPVDRYTRQETLIGYWALGLHWGPAKSNNKNGHLIGHIKDIGLDPNSPTTRLFATSAAQPFHNDAAGLSTLLSSREVVTAEFDSLEGI